jgi:hypothetical protein
MPMSLARCSTIADSASASGSVESAHRMKPLPRRLVERRLRIDDALPGQLPCGWLAVDPEAHVSPVPTANLDVDTRSPAPRRACGAAGGVELAQFSRRPMAASVTGASGMPAAAQRYRIGARRGPAVRLVFRHDTLAVVVRVTK